jgi:hypothetical protein
MVTTLTRNAETLSPTTFADKLTYSRAVEAAIWARPLRGTKAFIDGLQRPQCLDGNIAWWSAGKRITSLLVPFDIRSFQGVFNQRHGSDDLCPLPRHRLDREAPVY